MRKERAGKTPFIGVTPDIAKSPAPTAENQSEPTIFLPERYARAVLAAGGIPLLLPITSSSKVIRDTLKKVDGLLVSGGNFDIHPRLYGEESIESLGQIKEDRTEFELELITQALKRDLPLLGVCGGAQAINVALGGSLYQDISTQVPVSIDHQLGHLKEYGGHRVKVHAGTKLERIVGGNSLEVNSTHHQAVKELGNGLVVNATSEDGLIEGIENPNYSFILGVQWHPEVLFERDPLQRKIFSSLISICRGVH